jgi:hypothetical protein
MQIFDTKNIRIRQYYPYAQKPLLHVNLYFVIKCEQVIWLPIPLINLYNATAIFVNWFELWTLMVMNFVSLNN